MPPKTALHRLGDIIDLQISYLLTVGDSSAPLPNFLKSASIRKYGTGEIEYNFGNEVQIDVEELIPSTSQKRKAELAITPQKRNERKTQ